MTSLTMRNRSATFRPLREICEHVKTLRLFRPFAASGASLNKIDYEEVSTLVPHIVSGLYERSDVCERMGYSVLGPLLYGYATWLHDLLSESGAEELWFLAREGYILKRAYEMLYGRASNIRYVNVSRVALCRSSVCQARSFEDVKSIYSCLLSSVTTVGDLLDLMGLTSLETFEGCGPIDPSDSLLDVDEAEAFDNIVLKYGDYFKEQHSLAVGYLAGSGGRPKRVILCDIGWAGTMQSLTKRILPDVDVLGAYLAVSDYHDSERTLLDRTSLQRMGYWCGADEWKTKGQAIRFVQTAAEVLFLNSDGTTLGYERAKEGIRPVLAETRENDITLLSAEMTQRGGMSFISACMDAKLVDTLGPIEPTTAMLPFLNSIVRPTGETLRYYGRFRFVDGKKETFLTPKHGFLHYLTHVGDALEELNSNNSKIIWLKAVLKLPLPYFEILRLMTTGLGLKSKYEQEISTLA